MVLCVVQRTLEMDAQGALGGVEEVPQQAAVPADLILKLEAISGLMLQFMKEKGSKRKRGEEGISDEVGLEEGGVGEHGTEEGKVLSRKKKKLKSGEAEDVRVPVPPIPKVILSGASKLLMTSLVLEKGGLSPSASNLSNIQAFIAEKVKVMNIDSAHMISRVQAKVISCSMSSAKSYLRNKTSRAILKSGMCFCLCLIYVALVS